MNFSNLLLSLFSCEAFCRDVLSFFHANIIDFIISKSRIFFRIKKFERWLNAFIQNHHILQEEMFEIWFEVTKGSWNFERAADFYGGFQVLWVNVWIEVILESHVFIPFRVEARKIIPSIPRWIFRELKRARSDSDTARFSRVVSQHLIIK